MSETGERGGVRQRIVDDYAGYKLYDERGGKVGKVEYTVLDAEGRPEYLAVKTGLFGSNTTLIPEEIARPGDRGDEFEIQASEDNIKDAPTFDNEDDVNPDFEDRVREHFGLGRSGGGSSATSSESGHRDDEGRERGDPRSESQSDRESRDRGDPDRGDRDREGRSESGGDFDRDSRDARDEDRRSSETRSDSQDAAVAGGAAGGGMTRDDRGERRDDDRRGDDRRDDRSSSGSSSGGEREKVRVTVKRERARAERVRGEDGQEEVRIRKEMVEEEEMVEVEDRL